MFSFYKEVHAGAGHVIIEAAEFNVSLRNMQTDFMTAEYPSEPYLQERYTTMAKVLVEAGGLMDNVIKCLNEYQQETQKMMAASSSATTIASEAEGNPLEQVARDRYTTRSTLRNTPYTRKVKKSG